jgi:MoxR-like ATPase
MADIREINEKIERESAFIELLKMELDKVIIGQHYMIDRLLIGLLANGHILLEGVPGLAKTLAIKSLAQTVDAHFSRIQFTPDLLPADLVGTMIYNQKQEQFSVRKGPIFANFILADEINRAPAKVQSALLEAMQERQVTIGDTTHKLPEPFLVLATQNPVEETKIIRNNLAAEYPKPTQVVHPDQILRARQIVREVYMDEKIEKYIIDIVFATRFPKDHNLAKYQPLISFGASPRASISLALAAKAYAFIKRRGYVIPEDVRAVCMDVLRHRIGLTYEAEAENITTEMIINEILNVVEVP